MKSSMFKSVTGVILLALMSCTPVKNYDELMADARSKLDEKEYKEAVVLLKSALSESPQSVEARYQLGNAYLSIGNGVSAQKELVRAFDLGLLNEDIASKIMESILLQGNYDEAVNFADEVTPSLINKEWVRVFKLMALFYLNETESAPIDISLISSSQVQFIHLFSQLLESALSSDTVAVNRLLDSINLLENKPSEYHIFSGKFYAHEGEHKRAVDAYRAYLVERPEDYKTYIFLAESLLELGKFDEAEKEIDVVLKVNPNQPFANQIKATTKFHKGEFSIARELAQKSVNNGNKSYVNRMILGITDFKLGQYELAYTNLTKVIALAPDKHPINRVYQYTLFKLGYLDELAEDFSKASDIEQIDYKLLAATSYELIKSKNFNDARAALSKVDRSSFEPSSQYQISMMQLASDGSNSEQYLREMASLSPGNEQIKVALVLSYFRNKKKNEAFSLVNDWLENAPESSLAHSTLAYLYFKDGKPEEAANVYKEALVKIPQHNIALLYQSYQEELAGDLVAAEGTTLQLIKSHPSYLIGYSRLYQLHRKMNKVNETNAVLRTAIENDENPQLQLLYAEYLILEGKSESALSILSSVDNKYIRKHKLTADAHLKLSDEEAALNAYEYATNHSNDSSIYLPLLTIYEKNKEYDKAWALINKIEAENTAGNILIYYHKALFAIYRQDLQNASQYIEQLDNLSLNDPQIDNVKGLYYMFTKNYIKALDKLSSYYLFRPNHRTALSIYKAQKALSKDRDNIIFLKRHLEQFTQDDQARALLAQELLPNEPEQAENLYVEILSRNKNNWPIMVNLAWLYNESGKTVEAKKLVNRARELSNKHIATLNAYVEIMSDGKHYDLLIDAFEVYDFDKIKSVDTKLSYIEALIYKSEHEKATRYLDRIVPESEEHKKIADRLNRLIPDDSV